MIPERYQSRLSQFVDAEPNFARPETLELLTEVFSSPIESQHAEHSGWRIDRYKHELLAEAPGAPVAGGPFEVACQILERYEFPDPGILTGMYLPEDPLEQRVMLLKARFLVFTFWMGVRIGQIINETRNIQGEKIRVWGYSYYTLQGHFEMGEMTFEIWKYLSTGKVEFQIHAFSKTGKIKNWFYRLGFFFFGRWVQVRFAKRALRRMAQLVEERVTTPKMASAP